MFIVLFALGVMCGASLAFLAGAAWAALPRSRGEITACPKPGVGLTLVKAAPVGEREELKLAS